jgi:hypothetical protein
MHQRSAALSSAHRHRRSASASSSSASSSGSKRRQRPPVAVVPVDQRLPAGPPGRHHHAPRRVLRVLPARRQGPGARSAWQRQQHLAHKLAPSADRRHLWRLQRSSPAGAREAAAEGPPATAAGRTLPAGPPGRRQHQAGRQLAHLNMMATQSCWMSTTRPSHLRAAARPQHRRQRSWARPRGAGHTIPQRSWPGRPARPSAAAPRRRGRGGAARTSRRGGWPGPSTAAPRRRPPGCPPAWSGRRGTACWRRARA